MARPLSTYSCPLRFQRAHTVESLLEAVSVSLKASIVLAETDNQHPSTLYTLVRESLMPTTEDPSWSCSSTSAQRTLAVSCQI
jgi:hypothetical protein